MYIYIYVLKTTAFLLHESVLMYIRLKDLRLPVARSRANICIYIFKPTAFLLHESVLIFVFKSLPVARIRAKFRADDLLIYRVNSFFDKNTRHTGKSAEG